MNSRARPIPSSDKNDIIHEISDDTNVDIGTFLCDAKIGAKFTPTPRVTESALQSFPKYCQLGRGRNKWYIIRYACFAALYSNDLTSFGISKLVRSSCPENRQTRTTNVNTYRTDIIHIGTGTWEIQIYGETGYGYNGYALFFSSYSCLPFTTRILLRI